MKKDVRLELIEAICRLQYLEPSLKARWCFHVATSKSNSAAELWNSLEAPDILVALTQALTIDSSTINTAICTNAKVNNDSRSKHAVITEKIKWEDVASRLGINP